MKSIRINTFLTLLSFLSLIFFIGSYSFKDFSRPQDKGAAVTVGMKNTMKFTPDTVRIETGETVLWQNTSLLAHSVTGDPAESTVKGSAEVPEGAEPFNSGILDPKQTFAYTFKEPGTYQYFCIPHEGAKMFGWVVVE